MVEGMHVDSFRHSLSLSMLIKNLINKHHTRSTANDSKNSTSQHTKHHTQQAFTRVNGAEKCQLNQEEDATETLSIFVDCYL